MKRTDWIFEDLDADSGTPPEPDLFTNTETLDLNKLFMKDVTQTGSYDIHGVQRAALGRLLNSLPIPAFILADDHRILFGNESCARFSAAPNSFRRKPFTSLFTREADVDQVRLSLAKLAQDRKPQVTSAVIGIESRKIWGRVHMRSIRFAGEKFCLVLVEDLTAEKKQVLLAKKYSDSLSKARDELETRVLERTAELSLANEELKREIAVRLLAEQSLSLAANVIASSNEAILITDPKAVIVEVNEAFAHITGYAKSEVIGKNPALMASGRHSKDFWRGFWRALRDKGRWKGEVWDRKRTGEVYPKLLSVSAVKNEGGGVSHYVGIFSDITHIKHTEARLAKLAHYDPLTELPNRLLFRDRLHRAISHAEREKKSVAIMFIDLDEFKHVNDTIGHTAGDTLLTQVAAAISANLRQGDTVARMGGDEFTVIMPEVTELRHVRIVAHRIVEALSLPFTVDGHQVFTGASIGISLYPSDGVDIDALLQNADTAMYHAKSQGKSNFQFFSQKMNTELRSLVQAELTLRKAQETNNLLVYYQPVISCKTGIIVGAEALLRIRMPNAEIVTAGPLIPVAEERGLIVSIGDWVLKTACLQNIRFRDSGQSLRLAVNVSMRQLRRPGWADSVMRILEETGCEPTLVELELTETSMMLDPELAARMLGEIRRHGIKITVDDFGAGYSSLSYLRKLPIDKVKIDKSFIDEITQGRAPAALVGAMVNVAHSLDMTVVAEGVETPEQLKVIAGLNCDAWQGHLSTQALPADEFDAILKENKKYYSSCR